VRSTSRPALRLQLDFLETLGRKAKRKSVMEVKQIPNIKPESADVVTVKMAGNITEIRFSKISAGSPIKKVDKDHGVDVRTGELVEFQHNINRAGDKHSVAQTLKRLRDIINTNLESPDNALWVTFTYAENMRDDKQLYTDFHAFFKRFRRYQERKGQLPAEYIACAEPQGRGAWHLHLILLFPDRAPFIPNAEMARLWKHGFTKVKSLKNLENPGLYLTCYLGDMELTEAAQAGAMSARIKEVDVTGADGVRQKKAIIKGARLHMYPPGFNIYRTSRGIKRPTVSTMTEGEAQKLVGDAPLTYEKTISVTDEGGTIRNIINYRTFFTKTPAESDTVTDSEAKNAETSKDAN